VTCAHVFMKLREGLYPVGQDYLCANCGTTVSEAEKILFEAPTGSRN
jgi:hypothetical protein